MEWVETTARTVAEALEFALDQLGVDENDAEYEVLEEPRTGLFGRMRGQARVRARVRPTRPRPKVDRRDRRRRRPAGDDRRARSGTNASSAAPATEGPGDAPSGGRGEPAARAAAPTRERTDQGRRQRRGGAANGNGGAGSAASGEAGGSSEGSTMAGDVTVEEQATIVSEFLGGLTEAFALEATVADQRVDDETIEVQVSGPDLGLLIGPKGQTLQAVQELARTVVQRQAPGTHEGRIRIDVGGYRLRRREALERFTQQVAAQVIASGMQKALEPMNPADRKVVHDTANAIEGVETVSEGEEPRRRVVLLPSQSRRDTTAAEG